MALGRSISQIPPTLVALFAMGTHSALFGPVKYSILPQALHEEELVGGNGLVEGARAGDERVLFYSGHGRRD